MIYLDNAATTFPKPECVYTAANDCMRNLAVNAGRGTYHSARKAAELITDTRMLLAELVSCKDTNDVIFAPSATIAMNMVLNGLNYSANTVVYVSPFEHNAVMRPLHQLSKQYGFSIEMLPFDSKTQELNAEKMHNQFIIKHPDLVILNHVSNVTGAILPINKIFSEAKQYDAVTVLDTAQSLGLIPICLKEQPIDFLVFAGHKNLYGSFGTGGFIKNSGNPLKVFITGGTGSDSLNLDMPKGFPDRYEPASHDITAIAALKASLEWIRQIGLNQIAEHKRMLTNYLVDRLNEIASIQLYLPDDCEHYTSIVSFTHSDYRPNELADILDSDFDIAVRSGYHCAPYVHDLIGTRALGGTIRVSVGYFNTTNDIDKLIQSLEELE